MSGFCDNAEIGPFYNDYTTGINYNQPSQTQNTQPESKVSNCNSDQIKESKTLEKRETKECHEFSNLQAEIQTLILIYVFEDSFKDSGFFETFRTLSLVNKFFNKILCDKYPDIKSTYLLYRKIESLLDSLHEKHPETTRGALKKSIMLDDFYTYFKPRTIKDYSKVYGYIIYHLEFLDIFNTKELKKEFGYYAKIQAEIQKEPKTKKPEVSSSKLGTLNSINNFESQELYFSPSSTIRTLIPSFHLTKDCLFLKPLGPLLPILKECNNLKHLKIDYISSPPDLPKWILELPALKTLTFFSSINRYYNITLSGPNPGEFNQNITEKLKAKGVEVVWE